VVATPIGNLADIGARALEVLGRVPLVAAEDTRRFRVLAERHGLRPRRVLRCDEHAEARSAAQVVAALGRGEDAALTTDAGTPGVADPGARLVSAVAAAGFRVVPVPGPSAPLAALSASGFPGERFAFAGFPPRRAGARRAFLASHLERSETLLLLESPERAPALLADLAAIDPERRVVVARELTKLHEELVRGPAADVALRIAARASEPGGLRGEIVVVVAGSAGGRAPAGADGSAGEALARRILSRPWARSLRGRDLADLLALATGLDRRAAYRLAHGIPSVGDAECDTPPAPPSGSREG
jgi:16S rRNA (cytidine1402-2'-O)-methyltransferase